MKRLFKINLAIIVITIFGTSVFAQKAIYVSYDEAYMDKYQYSIENLSAYDFHNAFHIYTSQTDKIILNTAMSSYQTISSSTTVQAPTDINWSSTLLNEVNTDLTDMHIVFTEGNVRFSYKISSIILVQETANEIMYAGPFYSFTFNKQKTYDAKEYFAKGKLTNYNESIFMNSVKGNPMNCLNQFNFVKVIKDSQPKNSFTMIANEDFTKLPANEIYETCKEAIYIDVVENIGIVKESTKSGTIELFGINDTPIKDYIDNLCTPQEYSTMTTTSTQPVEANPILTTKTEEKYNTKSLNEAKAVAATIDTKANTTVFDASNTTIIKASDETTEEGEYELIFEMAKEVTQPKAVVEELPIKANTTANPINTTKASIVHIVDNGETLYGIAKKYGVTMEELVKLNNLKNNSIEVTQEIIIKK